MLFILNGPIHWVEPIWRQKEGRKTREEVEVVGIIKNSVSEPYLPVKNSFCILVIPYDHYRFLLI